MMFAASSRNSDEGLSRFELEVRADNGKHRLSRLRKCLASEVPYYRYSVEPTSCHHFGGSHRRSSEFPLIGLRVVTSRNASGALPLVCRNPVISAAASSGTSNR